jgi:hypothetical protein
VHHRSCAEDARAWFAALWCRINGVESWLANPFVWRVEFKRVPPDVAARVEAQLR